VRFPSAPDIIEAELVGQGRWRKLETKSRTYQNAKVGKEEESSVFGGA
jgi:hypothetical protein